MNNLKKAIFVTLLISIFMIGAVSAMDVPTKTKTSSSKVTKASLNVFAPSVTNPYKQSQKFDVTVINKNTGNAMKGVKLTMKVYTGKKSKTYKLKTNAKGLASINTKSLKKGSHKVIIKIKGTKKYKAASKTSKIQISNKIPTSITYQTGLIFHATTSYIGYTMHSHTYSVDIHVILKDNNGKELHKPVTLYHSDGYSASGTSGETITVNGGRPGQVTLKFNGDKKYMPSSYTINLGNEPF